MAIWLPNLEGRRGPKYLQIVAAMAEDVAAGRLPVGTQLPPHRELAYQLGLSPNTTARAYAEGVRQALLRGEVGRGTFVRVPDTRLQGSAAMDLRRADQGPIDLSRNLPLAGLAAPHVRRVMGEIAGGDGLPALLDYQTEMDISRHVAAASSWLARSGIDAGPEEIVLTNGAQHGILCSLMALLKPGDLLLTEALTYPPARALAERLGLKTGSVAVDDDGLHPDALAAACESGAPAALYLMPTLHTPTGRTLSPARRRAVAEIATRHNLLVIEDDVFGLLKPDRPAPIAAQAPDRTIYVTSVSKCLAPGLRVGILRASPNLAPALRHAVNLSHWMTPPVTAEIFTRLSNDGTADTLIAAQRNAATARQALARTVLGGHTFAADPNGLHIWLPLPAGWTADAFRAVVEQHGVLVAEARAFAAHAADAPEAVRLCLSHEVDEARLRHGLETVAGLLGSPPYGAGLVL